MDRGMPDEARPHRLAVEVRRMGGSAVVTASGELDHHTADTLYRSLHESVADGCARLVIDCSGLDFCDSTGLNVLLAARVEAEAAGGQVHLAGTRPAVSRVLEITGANTVFTLHGSLDDALAALPAD